MLAHTSTRAAREAADFCITIDYKKGEGNPARVFTAMGQLINAFQEIDSTLINSVDSSIRPVLLLEDVETGSVKAWVRQALESLVDDDALKDLSIRKQIGAYLVKGKYALIDFMEETTTVTDADLVVLEDKLQELAGEAHVNLLPAYNPISRRELLQDMARVQEALEPLEPGDKASFNAGPNMAATFNLEFHVAPETIQELTVSEVQEYPQTMILKVKKPDFIGDSMWQFVHDKAIDATIEDRKWLRRFQAGAIALAPGDAVRARVMVRQEYGLDNELVRTTYAVLEVLEVMARPRVHQTRMLESEGIAVRSRDITVVDEE